LVFAYISK